MHGDCNARGLSHTGTRLPRAGITESHIRPSGSGRRRVGGAGERKESIRLRARIKLSRVYILHTLFNFTTSRFNSDDGFSTITRPYFSPPASLLHTTFLPSSTLSISLSFSLASFHYIPPPSASLSLSLPPASGMAHHFVNQDKLEISSREIHRLRLGGIYWATTVYPVVPTRY